MSHPNIGNGPIPDAVIDTNVLLDFLSAHNAYEELKGDDEIRRDMRWHRAGDGLRLAIHLDEIGAATTAYDTEAVRVLKIKADATKPGFSREYVRIFVTFVYELLLPNWKRGSLEIQGDPKGNAADRRLVEIAAQLGVPLISQELDPKKEIRKHAAKLGVDVQTPKEFCGSGPSKKAIERFMENYAMHGPSFRRGEPDYEFTQEVLRAVWRYYVSVFEETAPDAHRRTDEP